MFLKLLSENKIIKNLNSKLKLPYFCGIIVLLSIYIRSLADIGPDTGVYLDVGKKLALGKDYFVDIFEINFPILMWLYAFQYKLSIALNISPILISEFFVNCGGLISIYSAFTLLKRTEISQNKTEFNLLILCFFMGFFIRPFGMHLFEFGTKSSYFLMLFYPYLSLILINQNSLSKIDLFIKGILMALILSLKPHYLFFIVLIEFFLLIKYRSWRFLFSIDKLVFGLFGILYFVLIQKIHPNFFEYVVPMWSNYFRTYRNIDKLLTNFYSNMAFVIFPFFGAFLIYCRYKIQDTDKTLIVVFIASALVVVVENIFTIDQFSLFCAINLILIARIVLIILRNNFLNFSENLFFLGFFVIVPLSQPDFIRMAIFGFGGVFNLWWLMLIYSFIILYKKLDLTSRKIIFSKKNILIFLTIYFASFFLMIWAFKGSNYWLSNFFALLLFVLFYFISEKYFFTKISEKFTPFSTFMIMASLFIFVHDYSNNFRDIWSDSGFRNKFRKIYDFKSYYYKTKAPKANDNEINFYSLHQLAHPINNYYNKNSSSKISVYGLNSLSSYQRMMFPIHDPQTNFVYDYIIRDIKRNLRNKDTKLIFVDNFIINEGLSKYCVIGYIEYLFFDKEIKDYFLKNYKFENRLILAEHKYIEDDFFSKFYANQNDKELAKYQLTGAFNKILFDIEVYVRKD